MTSMVNRCNNHCIIRQTLALSIVCFQPLPRSAIIYADADAIRATRLRPYRDSPDVAILLELMTDFDEGLQEWRYRHVKMVQSTIGTRPGTGGSAGAAYLATTLMQPLFPDLWAIRARL